MKINHTHKFKRFTYKTGTKIYMCVLDCNFRVSCELALGKKCVCWRCGKDFVMNNYSITLAKPHCEECHVHKSEFDKRKLPTRRTNEVVIQSPSELVTAIAGDDVISNMRERLTSTQVQVKEFEIKDDDFLE